MKGLTIIMISLVALMNCSKNGAALDPKSEFNSESPNQSQPLKLLYIVDGVELKSRQELLAIRDKEHVTTIFPSNSALTEKYGDRAKYGVAVITTKQ